MLSACNTGGRDFFAGLWEQDGGPPAVAHAGMTVDTFQQVSDRLVATVWRLKHLHGCASRTSSARNVGDDTPAVRSA